MRKINFIALWPTILFFSGCGGQGGPQRIEDLPIDAEEKLAGLEAPVDVVIDNRGMPHIYAAGEHDALVVQGYLMAADRLAQMELFRRSLQGTMCEIISPLLVPSLLDQDIGARQLGFHRMAREIFQMLQSGDPVLEAMEAFSAGVNLYIARVRSGEISLPAGLGGLLPPAKIADWTPIDILTIARYMSYDLSKRASDELARTLARQTAEEKFNPQATDARYAARAGIFRDLWPLEPAKKVYTREGFPNLDSDSGSRALWRPRPLAPEPAPRVSRRLIEDSLQNLQRTEELLFSWLGLGGGSNNWAVHGSRTASGYPLLASDPHLALQSPNFFWYVHLNTSRRGGDLNASGLALFGTPGILLGYNDKIAWGLTVTNFDVDDVYLEQVLPGSGGQPDRVLFKGQEVPIQTIQEVINITGQQPHSISVEWIPHHGQVLSHEPGSTEAISRRWLGYQPSLEIKALLKMLTASSLEEVEDALDSFEVGSQNWMVVTASGDIFWSTQSGLPQRDARALNYDAGTAQGIAPCFVLPGNGDYEWTERLSDRYLPHDRNPARGYLATANQDLIGVSDDGNPFNDAFYLGWDFDLGFRMARIDQRLKELTTRGGVTPQDISELQGDHRSPLGEALTASMVQAASRALEEKNQPGKYPDLSALVTEESTRMGRLSEVRDRLQAWQSFLTPGAVEDEPTEQEIADSVAATIFNVALTRLIYLTFEDEVQIIGQRPSSQQVAKAMVKAVNHPEEMSTYDAAKKDTVLWDDLATADVVETRDERMVRALLQALAWLEQKLGTEMNDWRWGKLHTLRLADITGMFGKALSIPPEGDEKFPNGFPRHGDNFVVDACNYSLWNRENYSYSSGPQQRLVVEMRPDGPRVWNARPGGQSQDPSSPHFADDVEFWRKNQAPELFFREKDVVEHAEKRLRFVP